MDKGYEKETFAGLRIKISVAMKFRSFSKDVFRGDWKQGGMAINTTDGDHRQPGFRLNPAKIRKTRKTPKKVEK